MKIKENRKLIKKRAEKKAGGKVCGKDGGDPLRIETH